MATLRAVARALSAFRWRVVPAALLLIAGLGGCERERTRYATLAEAWARSHPVAGE